MNAALFLTMKFMNQGCFAANVLRRKDEMYLPEAALATKHRECYGASDRLIGFAHWLSPATQLSALWPPNDMRLSWLLASGRVPTGSCGAMAVRWGGRGEAGTHSLD